MTLPDLRAARTWGVLMLVLGVLDGWTGFALGVGVAALLLARVRTQVIGWAGVVAWLGVPVAVVLHGLPRRAEVSPAFAFDNQIANHLAFVGFALLVIAAALVRPTEPQPVQDAVAGGPLGRSAPAMRWGLIGVVALVALVASALVVRT